MRTKAIGFFIATAALLSGGCSYEEVNETHQGRLEQTDQKLDQDGSYYDGYEFEARQGWKIVLELESEDFDAYVHLMDAKGKQLAHNDDAEPGGSNARLEFVAPESGKYMALANSLHGGATGAYTMKITAKAP